MISPARSGWISRPAGQGFMSTQRRENRWQRISCDGAHGRIGRAISSFTVAQLAQRKRWNGPAGCNGTSTPATKTVAGRWLATNSLQLVTVTALVRLVLSTDNRRGSPPSGAGRRAVTGTPATLGSSLPLIPSPSGLACLHPTLPQVPAGKSRWAERYDGKGNLYFQHAA